MEEVPQKEWETPDKKKKVFGRPIQKGMVLNPTGRPKDIGKVRELAKQFTREALTTIVDLMLDPSEKGSVRLAAAEAILSRGWGRPEQSVNVTHQDVPLQQQTTIELMRILDELKSENSNDVVEAELIEHHESNQE